MCVGDSPVVVLGRYYVRAAALVTIPQVKDDERCG